MPTKNENRRVVYIHSKEYYAIVERRGKGIWGEEYCIRETIYPPFPWQKNEPKLKPEPQPVQTTKADRITEQDKTRFAKLYRQGYSIRRIAKISGWSDTAVCKHLTRMGVVQHKVGRTISYVTKDEKALFAKLYRQDRTVDEIAAISDRSKTTVFRYSNLMGLIRRHKKLTASEKAQMKQMAQNGISIRKIAAAMGYSKYTVYKYLYLQEELKNGIFYKAQRQR